MDNSEIIKRLSSINWNFDFTIDYSKDAIQPFNCRKYYSYPATFIPEIPYALIEILSNKGDVVLDPFGGIGTTFFQALTLERIPITFDINPVATSVCKALYLLFDPTVDKHSLMTCLLTICEEYDNSQDYTTNLSERRRELKGWFEKETFNEVAFLMCQFDSLQESIVKETMRLVLSSVLVTLSSQNKGWAYIADNVKPKDDELKKKQVFEQYRSSVRTLITDVSKHMSAFSDSYNDFYLQISKQPRIYRDSLVNTKMNSDSVNLLITSPPYPRMIDYVKSQRLTFCFFDDDFRSYTEDEIGARYRRSRQDSLRSYEQSIKQVNNRMVSLLKRSGYLCVVLPDYDSQDNRKETIESIITDYRKLGMTKVFEVGRYIPSHKRTLSIQWATLINERIYIFQKG